MNSKLFLKVYKGLCFNLFGLILLPFSFSTVQYLLYSYKHLPLIFAIPLDNSGQPCYPIRTNTVNTVAAANAAEGKVKR